MFSGASFIEPNKTWEAAFAGVCVLIGAMFVTAITSSLAAILIEAQEVQQEMKRKDRALTAFMEQRRTPVLLALAVRKEFLAKCAEAARLSETDLPFLTVINPSLRASLREAEYRSHYLKFPLFRILSSWSDSDINIMQELCYVISTLSVGQAGQEIFNPGKSMEHCLLLSEGNMRYIVASSLAAAAPETASPTRAKTSGIVRFTDPSDIGPGAWICELALFMHWKTRGIMQAQTTTEMLQVSVDGFLQLVSRSPGMISIASSYANAVCLALQPKPSEMPNPTDVDAGLDVDVLISNLHWTIRQLMSVAVLAEMFRHQQHFIGGFLRRKSLADLETEVLAGKCYLLKNIVGSITRVVRLVVLRLVNQDGLLCISLGWWRVGACNARQQLPGVKLEGRESPAEGIERLLEQDFKSMAPYVRLEEVETTVEESVSESYNLETKYIKVIQTATLEAQMVFGSHLCDGESVQSLSRNGMSGTALGTGTVGTGTRTMTTATPSMKHASTKHSVSANGLRTHSAPTMRANSAPTFMKQNSLLRSQSIQPVEGPMHAFATGSPTVMGSTVNLYKWMHPDEFEQLTPARRAEDDAATLLWMSQLNTERLKLLTRWNMTNSRPIGSYMRNADSTIQESSEAEAEHGYVITERTCEAVAEVESDPDFTFHNV